MKIGKPVGRGVISDLKDVITDNKLIYKQFKCNCCGTIVNAHTVVEVILLDKTCDRCLSGNRPIEKLFKDTESNLKFDDLKRTKKKKIKLDKNKLDKRRNQSRIVADGNWDRFRSNVKLFDKNTSDE